LVEKSLCFKLNRLFSRRVRIIGLWLKTICSLSTTSMGDQKPYELNYFVLSIRDTLIITFDRCLHGSGE